MRNVRTLLFISLSLLLVSGVAWAKKSALGRPAFKAGDAEGYWIWVDEAGWHLRTTTPKKQQHTFRGVVRAEGFGAVKASRAELTPKLQLFDGQVKFEFDLFTGSDGFDWQQTEDCATFELRVDGRGVPERIHVGAKAEAPEAALFLACRK